MRRLMACAAALGAIALLSAMLLAGSAWASPYGPGTSQQAASAETQKAPAVTKQPVAKTIEEGQSATFESAASGVPAPSVQWERSTNGASTWSPILGATSPTLTVTGALTSESGYEFRAVFKNTLGEATSKAATLTVRRAPAVTLQPVGTTVEEGQSASFEAAASGVPAPTVAWEFSADGGASWSAASGGTSTHLTVSSTKTSYNGREYRATFKNAAGTATSAPATLTVHKAPVLTKQPLPATVEEGQSAVFEATASGFPAPTVQWQMSTTGGSTWSPLEGATSTQLTIAATTTSQSGEEVRAVFTNAAGEATSAQATLTVQKAPAVTQQPLATTVEEGQSASFEAAASGFPAPGVQWELSINGGGTWSAVAGGTAVRLTVAGTTTSESGHEYRATFKNAAGQATTQAVVLTVQRTPAVTKQPASTTALEGQSATFEATASGFPAPTVQWQVSGDAGATWNQLEGATSVKLTLASVSVAQSGSEYRAVFTNAAGEAISGAATLTVHAPPVVTEQPASTTVEAGQGASFQAAASGTPTPTVQWEVSANAGASWSAVAGETSDQLTIATTSLSENGHEYRAVFTNAAGSATSAVATLNVASTHYSAVAWGQNLHRQLGNGSSDASSDVPLPVSDLKFVTAVSAGATHSLALLANGTVVAWGDNEFGQLGDGSTATRSVPVAVSGLTGVKAIAAGGTHSLALLGNGTVMAWGNNESGQLGNGTTSESEVPVAVNGLTGVKAIAAGGSHSLALMGNGTVMAWGSNESGQLGNASGKSTSPVAVKGLSGVAAISAGGEFSVALLTKGTVEAWGSDEAGQLGNSSAEEPSSNVPVPVSGLSGVTAIAAGTEHALALLGGGTVMAWGSDSSGELGNATIKGREETPVAVSGLSGVTAITAGGHDSAALLAAGSVMSWGINTWGTLGDGASGGLSDVPVLVRGIDKVASIAAGGFHMLAFGEPTPAITAVSPSLGPASGGTVVTLTGANLSGASAVKFGASPATSFTVTSPTTVEALAPAGTGTVDITVTTPAGVSPAGTTDHYTYEQPPAITKLSVKSGPVAGGTSVTITGTAFSGASGVSFGGTSASFTVNSATSITASSPAGVAGIANVTVTTPGGTSAISTKDRFSYTPTVEALAPSNGPAAGGVSVTVTGTGFATATGATSFKFGTAKASAVACSSSTSCTAVAPAGTAGTVNVTATVSKASSPVNAPADDFTYG
jgi:alpha-tubulin suppressor-like RCC1 family protein